MNKADKTSAVADLKKSFSESNAAFFADYKGLTVEQVNDLRRRLRPHKVRVKVIKNNLARLAVREAKMGEASEKLIDSVVGPTMVAFAYGDPAAAAKVVQKFVEENEVFGLKDSLLSAQRLTIKQVEELSKLPSRQVLLAKLLGTLNAPITNFVGVLAAVPRSLVQVLAAIEDQKKKQA
ncbi:MAG: 50S ribosomal protein L10 [Deltaproteobacteria bacterium]|nr:50S ribosomal protein L10 [Deltaproteobacteria bacterium]